MAPYRHAVARSGTKKNGLIATGPSLPAFKTKLPKLNQHNLWRTAESFTHQLLKSCLLLLKHDAKQAKLLTKILTTAPTSPRCHLT